MTDLLLKVFIKDNNYADVIVREKVGVLSSITGIVLNIFLFLIKFIMGTLANSIAIISDGFNNLSDSASCIITLFGYKMAAKPADKDHPFGHGRFEYLTSLVIATIILLVGFELFKNSFDKIITPNKVVYSTIILISLVFSVICKLWMSMFNNKLGKLCNSSVMLATSKDSRNDVVTTFGTIVALILSQFTDLPIDGIVGVLVSLFVLFSGFGIVRDTVDELLGKPISEEQMNELINYIESFDCVIGVHDVLIHNYGPSKQIGSAHVEVSSHGNVLDIHDSIDMIEREIYTRFKIMMTLHMDPIDESDAVRNKCKLLIKDILNNIDSNLTFHDLRVVSGPTHTNIIFDVVMPFNFKYSNDELHKLIDDELAKEDVKYFTVVTFDNKYL